MDAAVSRSVRVLCAGFLLCGALYAAPPAVPAPGPLTHEALVSLGRQLFFDARLSADGRVSCASCHRPDQAFQDGLPVAQGVFGQLGTRNTPSLLRAREQRLLFWDGRRSGLAEQAFDPLLNAREHGLNDKGALVQRLSSLPDYAPWFKDAGPPAANPMPVDVALVGRALAAYESSLDDGESSFEKFYYHGDEQALSDAARRGWAMFSGRGRCITCHEVAPHPPALFTDQSFHALVQGDRANRPNWSVLVDRFMHLKAQGGDAGQILLSDQDLAALGRFVVTEDPADIGKFKTPSLRNVALTAPYMHDGSVATLTTAIELEIYYRGTQDGHPLIFTDAEKQDLAAFLQSLTAFDPARHAREAAGSRAPLPQ